MSLIQDGPAPAGRQPSPDPGAPAAAPAVLPTRHGDAFRHWQEKGALASDAELLKCLEQARECIGQMNHALSLRDEPFTRIHLEPATHDDDAG